VLKQQTTGAGNDIERATDIARRMVCEWGMSDVLGPLTFGAKEEQIFLGRDIAQSRDYSEQTAQTIDREVRDIVDRNYKRARELLSGRMQTLHGIAEALLEFETIDGEEVELICQGKKIERKPPENKMGSTTPPAATPVTSSEGGSSPAPLPA
jgi:cell division protease FtsH